MTVLQFPLATFYKPGWENYQHAFAHTIAPLSSEQLSLPVTPQYVSIRELLIHMLGARYNWFSNWMGEESTVMAQWRRLAEIDEPEAADLVAMFELSWHVLRHDIHHGGELAVGMGGYDLPTIWRF